MHPSPVPPLPSPWCWSRSKRAVDVVLGIASLPIVLPTIALLSAVSAVNFRCNPLFIQRRHGVDEEKFSIVKIRSLPKTFHRKHGKHALEDHAFEGWSHLLRRSHLDELPQVFNVIGGSMSIVGPRPMITEVVELLEPADRAKRATVKPGLTGPWQVSTMGSESLHDCPELDNHYVDHATFTSDVRFIWWTVTSVLGRPSLEPAELLRRLGW